LVTNTIPQGEFTLAQFNRVLKRYRDRFERRWKSPAVYVKEFQASGEPHLHFVVVWLSGGEAPSQPEFIAWNDRAWVNALQSAHPSHVRQREGGKASSACSVEVVRDWARVTHYLSGYLSKGLADPAAVARATGRMWGRFNRKLLPVSWVDVEVTDAERKAMTRALVRCRQSRRVVLLSSAACPVGVKAERWMRFSACFKGIAARSFMEHQWMKMHREHGYRLRVIRPRLYRRNGVKLWDQDEGSGKVERRCVEQKMMRRFCPVEGKKVEVWCDEIESVAAAWHYLPAAEVLRLLAYVRRDAEAGLTACEKRWARS
jgi:hypothetical protein